MKGIAVMIISLFSVVIPIQSREIIYNYDNFGDIFPQSDSGNDFHVYKYAEIDNIFDEKYEGTNIGGAYLVQGTSYVTTSEFKGQLVSITATIYCAKNYWGTLMMAVGYPGFGEYIWICNEHGSDWNYNITWSPPSAAKYQKFNLIIGADSATINRVYGFDELRITTSD